MREMRHDDGFYNNSDNGVDYLDNKNIINIDEAYDLMFLPTKRRYNGNVLAACMREARIVFDSFPWSVTCKWDCCALRLNSIPVSDCFEEPPSVLFGDTNIVYINHLFHYTIYFLTE